MRLRHRVFQLFGEFLRKQEIEVFDITYYEFPNIEFRRQND